MFIDICRDVLYELNFNYEIIEENKEKKFTIATLPGAIYNLFGSLESFFFSSNVPK